MNDKGDELLRLIAEASQHLPFPMYLASRDVEHDGATLPAGSLVSGEHPAVRAYPDSFDRVLGDGSTVPQPIHARPTPAVMMSDGTIVPLEVPPRPAEQPAAGPARRRSGPALPICTLADVEAVRAKLDAAGRKHGYKSIAKAGGWSVATVRRRLAGN